MAKTFLNKTFFTTQANLDLVEIWNFIAEQDLPAADRFIDEVDRCCRRLEEFPDIGQPRRNLAPSLRSFPVGNYILFYQLPSDRIVVIRILHRSRDVAALVH